MTEEIYQNLTQGESVHLETWPETKFLIDEDLITQMQTAIEICSSAHALRKEADIKVRQPLAKLTYKAEQFPEEIEKIIAQEVNVKSVVHDAKIKETIVLDTTITPELKLEGEARDLVRAIQEKRKEAGLSVTDKINVEAPSWPEQFTDYIKAETNSDSLKTGATLSIKRLP